MIKDYDHKGGQPVDLPVGSVILLPPASISFMAERVIRDDDGWRIESFDLYLPCDIEEYNFDVVSVPDVPEEWHPEEDPDTIRDRILDARMDADAETGA